ncbi:hypothetical protein L873DRAFT_303520 [Choiromyces venosus 120613-1]|uniref:Uncharacterized protein n=1 Tax=Choiromyces venosus 120613-1 TaxID=1336337 RepID=A0A3N4J097_9PEZI|nr:hypothetical protein L873DRAFT_303520 [Choiromyces venosus 120613-1]
MFRVGITLRHVMESTVLNPGNLMFGIGLMPSLKMTIQYSSWMPSRIYNCWPISITSLRSSKGLVSLKNDLYPLNRRGFHTPLVREIAILVRKFNHK